MGPETKHKNSYLELKNKHQKEVNEFPIFFAFSDKQLHEGMEKLGITDIKLICPAGAGGYVRKTDAKKLIDLMDKFEAERKSAIENDKTGEGYIFDMFSYELSNHEYSYTGELEETLDSLGMKFAEIEKNPALANGLQLAIAEQR